MFENIGRKIKGLAVITFGLLTFASLVGGISLMVCADSFYNDDMVSMIGFAMLFVGPFIAWLSSCFLYAFGELVDNSAKIAKNTDNSKDTEKNN